MPSVPLPAPPKPQTTQPNAKSPQNKIIYFLEIAGINIYTTEHFEATIFRYARELALFCYRTVVV